MPRQGVFTHVVCV